MIKTRYPHFDVMDAREEWDEHTQHVITKRMADPVPPHFFSRHEARTLRVAVSELLAEQDPWLLDKVVEHIDTMLANEDGEGYRPEAQPPDHDFWHMGITQLGINFPDEPAGVRRQALRDLQENDPAFFKALLGEAVTGYCSLPPVWSFMGYGGPAYPRGYVRIELGLIDPWEAKQDVD